MGETLRMPPLSERPPGGGGGGNSGPPASPIPIVDERASRVAQGLAAVLALVPIQAQSWPLLALPLVHLVAALAFGRRGDLGILAFDALLARRLGLGRQRDARPLRFANLLGAVILAGGIAARLAGHPWLGWRFVALQATLAAVAAAIDFCLGCRLYALLRHLRARPQGSAPRRAA